jgi:hypothetical protein
MTTDPKTTAANPQQINAFLQQLLDYPALTNGGLDAGFINMQASLNFFVSKTMFYMVDDFGAFDKEVQNHLSNMIWLNTILLEMYNTQKNG